MGRLLSRVVTSSFRSMAFVAPVLIATILFHALALPMPAHAQPFELILASPSLDRWMYPHKVTPGSRSTAPVFGTLGDESGVDSRHGQFLIGFDLSSQVPTNLGPGHYLIRQCRISVT